MGRKIAVNGRGIEIVFPQRELLPAVVMGIFSLGI
jgi:hypothetical protein